MHEISSYHGNTQTNAAHAAARPPAVANAQTGQYTAPLSLARSVTGRLHAYDRRTDWSNRPRLRSTGRSDQSDRPVGQTVAEPLTSINQINVAC